MSVNIGALHGLIGIDNELSRELDAAYAKLGQFGKQWQDVGGQMMKVGAGLTAALTLPIMGAGAAALSVGMEFEASMNAIVGVLGVEGEALEAVKAKAIEMGAATAFSANDAAEAMLALGKTGFTVDEALSGVDEVMQLAAASGLDMASAADMAGRTLNQFGLGVEDLSHVNDVLASAVNKSSLEISDLQTAFQYIGPVAQGMGISVEEASAALALMRDNGVAASSAGRGLASGLTNLLNPTKAVREGMASLGLEIGSFKNSEGNLIPLDEVIQKLGPHATNTGAMMKIFGKDSGPDMAALLMQGHGAFATLVEDFKTTEGSAKAMADAMTSGLPGAVERMKGSIETAALVLYDRLQPAALAVVGAVEKIANFFSQTLIPAFAALPMPIQLVSGALLALAAAAGPVIVGVGMIVSAWGTLAASTAVVSAMTAAGAAIASIALPVTVAVAALAGLYYAWQEWGDDVTAVVSETFETVKGFFVSAFNTEIVQSVVNLLDSMDRAWLGFRDNVIRSAGNVLDAARENFGTEFNRVVGGMKDKLDDMDSWFANSKASIGMKSIVQQAKDNFNTEFFRVVDAVKTKLDQLAGWFQDVAISMGASIRMPDIEPPKIFQNVKKDVDALNVSIVDANAANAVWGNGFRDVAPKIAATTEETKKSEKATKDKEAADRKAKEAQDKWNESISHFGLTVSAINTGPGAQWLATNYQIAAAVKSTAEEARAVGEEFTDLYSDTTIVSRGFVELKKKIDDNDASMHTTAATALTMGDRFRDMGEGIQSAIGNFGATVVQALTGGGNLWGAVKALGSQIGSTVGSGIGAAFGPIGAQLGGAIGSLLGPAIDKVGGAIKNLFGIGVNAEVKKYNLEIESVRATLLTTHGTLDQLDAKAKAVGLSFKNEWGHQGKEGLDLFNKFVKEFDGRVGDVNRSFSELFAEAASMGERIPQDLLPTIEHLINIGVITDDNAEKFRALTDGTKYDFEQMQGLAEQYGVDLAALGPQFHSAKLHDAAAQIWNDFQLLVKGGADVGGVLEGMQDEISELVNDSILFGTAIPENMRPMIEELVRAGKLIGADGQALVDMSKIQFGDPIVNGFERIVTKIEELIGKIGGINHTMAVGLPEAARRAADGIKYSFGEAEEAARNLGDVISDAIIIEHSPTGLQGIATYAGYAAEAIKAMSGIGIEAMDALGRKVGVVVQIGGVMRDGFVSAFDDMARSAENAGEKIHKAISTGLQAGTGLDDILKKTDYQPGAGGNKNMISLEQAIQRVQGVFQRYEGRMATQDELNAMAGQFGYRGEKMLDEGAVMEYLKRLLQTYEKRSAGSIGATGSWFENFGSGTAVELHGTEAVVRKDQAQDFANAFSGGDPQVLGALTRIARSFESLPQMMFYAARDGQLARTGGA
jgi:TP901 family phage tail tape measure protein